LIAAIESEIAFCLAVYASKSAAGKTSPVNTILFISSTPANFTVKCFSK